MHIRLVLAALCGPVLAACSSAPATSSTDGGTSHEEGGAAGGSDSGASSVDSGGATGGARTVKSATKVTTSVPISAAYIAIRANGNLVLSDPTALKLFEVKPDGTLVATNAGDWSAALAPGRVGIDGNDKVYVMAGKTLRVYGADISAAGAVYLASAGSNNPYISDFAWGGPNRAKLFVLVQALPKGKLLRYDAATAAAPGASSDVGLIDDVGQTLIADTAGNAYTYEVNGCRITRFSPTNEKKVVVGNPTANQCALGALQDGRTGQGSGMRVDASGKILFAEKMNDRIVEFTIAADGTMTQRSLFEQAGFKPTELDIAPDGTLFVVDASKAVWKLAF